MSFSEYRGSEQFQIDQAATYTVGGVTYSVETGLPVQVTDGPPSITSQVPVAELPGTSFQNQLYPLDPKRYVLWSNPEGTSWSIREPEITELGGSGFSLDGGITSTPGNIVVTDGIEVLGYENVLSSDQIKDGIEIIKDKIDKENIINDGTPEKQPEKTGGGEGGEGGEGGGDKNASNAPFKLEPLKIEFGKVDNIIQKLALRNLIYPIDADFGNTQDYMQINQWTYRAPNQSVFFGTDEQKNKLKTNPYDIASGGLPLGTPREKSLGLVKLPMPNSLADSNNVSWGADQLNALTAAVASGVMGQVNPFLQNIFGEIGEDKGNMEKAGGLIMATVNQVREAFSKAGIEVGKGARDFATPGSNLNVLGTTVLGSALLNAFQFGITPETILARGQGVVPNNNLSLLFNSPTLREFTFTWKLTPRSREEAQRVNNIIRFFKQGMAPKKGISTATGEGSYFLGTPNVFDLKFKTTTQGGNFFYEGDDINHSVVRIKTCACTGCAVNYTPDGMWNAYERGQPVSVTMSLRFAELEPIFDTDYDEDLFNYSENRPDLQPIPIDAVGY